MFDDTEYKIYSVLGIVIIGAMFITGLFLSCGSVVGQTTEQPVIDAQPQAYIESRFILWDIKEKSIDKTFDINLISWSNVSSYYTINVNGNITNGTFYQYKQLNYTIITNVSRITIIEVSINNITVLFARDIRIVAGITQSGIDTISEPYKISFLPFELTKLEWNLVFSGIVGVLISLPTAYFTIKYYRKHRGAQVL